MNARYFLMSCMFFQFLSADEHVQNQAAAGMVIKDFNLSRDKQVIKDMFIFDWDQLCVGCTHGYTESIVDGVLEFMQGSCKVLYQGNQLVGFIEYDMKSENRAHIDSLGVHKDYRGKGFGIILLQYAFKDIASWGVDYVTIDVILSNDIARNLYENKFKFHPLYIKYHIDAESGQESPPVLSLGRAINSALWNSETEQMIIVVDEIFSEIEEYRMESFCRSQS
ncbi:MAG: GNAT family N-acetyltransferase [Candidatus Chromulinivorax sp.]|nr:GNAT family N-acetyltransferase [Candidatus Chromulinivorax sp.]